MHTTRRLAATAAIAALLSVAACGGGDGDNGGGGAKPTASARTAGPEAFKAGPDSGWSDSGITVDPAKLACASPGGEQARGVTDTEIKVGGLISQSSTSGPVNAGMDVGAKVRFSRANDGGGVNGRKINYIGTRDDGSDSARTATQAQSLAADGVFAAVPAVVRTGNFLDTFCKTGTPYFGWGTSAPYCNSTIGFGVTGCLVADPDGPTISTTWAMAASGILGGSTDKSVAFVGVDIDAAVNGMNLAAKGLKAAGFSVPYAKTPIPAAGLNDPTAIVNDLMHADKGAPPDLIVTIADFAPALKLIGALRAAGYPGKILTPLGYDPRLTGLKDLDGTYTLIQWAPAESGSAADEQLKADFAKYAPNQPVSLTAMAGYWSADFFLAAVQKTGRDLTVANLLKTLNGGGYSYHVPGAIGETQWPVNHIAAAPCASVVQLSGGKYVQAVKLACTPLFPNN
ncbi:MULTISPECIES: ABC transporter substrate-binding protein [unclassified Pseudofrankia]|uniref:ABC transporter substrate-binding protein n=1 Tax=unclassified Pseudofrankia TaxID=2994372 RepID=UPI0008DA79F2|nr:MULTISPECIES: ABC transporter substrate-binding protein [unclassified Pseudofrankia]MDT3441538.1 ABC transporter substrate-binding protein [Pseudofrankia sp. BMG5.37]OHV48953.1 branched-chain amino acid ABC transporter substrate-binding protein [Pseudofrankia sp. BMG5.36]